MRITKKQLRQIIRETVDFSDREANPHDGGMYGDPEGDDISRTPEVQAMLVAAGFNADGSFGMDGYPGPGDWQLYSPKSMEEAEGWIDAAIEMNDALSKAEVALDRGELQHAEDAFYKFVYPIQQKYSKHGAADTEGREVAAWWLEDQKGFRW